MGVVERCPGYWCTGSSCLVIVTRPFNSHHPSDVLPWSPLYGACTWPCPAWFASFVLLIFSGFAHKRGLCMVVPCSFSRCSEEFQFLLLWAYCFYHNHSSISKQNYSKEWRNWKWYTVIWWMKIQLIYLPNCTKNSKSSSSVFGDFRFPKCLTSFVFPQIFGGYLYPPVITVTIKTNFILCHVKPTTLSFTPTH
jgi:hypothetical protein